MSELRASRGTLRLITASLLAFVVAGCGEAVSDSRAREALTDEGYTGIAIKAQHGVSPHLIGGCGEDDAVAFDASAKNSVGKIVNVTVCCGLIIKGCTIRHK